MNLLFLSSHCCIRCVKEGLAMLEKGHSVVFLHQRVANPDMQAVIPLQSFWQSEAQLRQKLQTFVDIDLIHVHNEPSYLVQIAKEERPELPVVFDVHDLNSVRNRRPDPTEIRAMDAADGVIFPSEGYREYSLRELKYVFTGLADKPQDVIYSMCTRQMLEIPTLTRTAGIVYEGRIRSDDRNKDYRWMVREMGEMGVPFFVMPTSMGESTTYAQAGAIVIPTLPYVEMMRQLTRFDWGFSGPAIQCRDGDRGIPNKLFEYIMAGLPVIVYQQDEAARFVAQNNLGVVIEDVREIPEIYDQHVQYREAVAAKRAEMVMETQVDRIEALYRQAAAFSAERGGWSGGKDTSDPTEQADPSDLSQEASECAL